MLAEDITLHHGSLCNKVAHMMRPSRIFYALLLVFILLLTQQGGLVHTLRHALAGEAQLDGETRQDQQLPHAKVCGQCVAYAQSGAALAGAVQIFAVTLIAAAALRSLNSLFHSTSPITAVARGPPVPLQ